MKHKRRDKIDALIDEALKERANHSFKIDQIARMVLAKLGPAPSWRIDLGPIVLQHIKGRVHTTLRTAKDADDAPLYENFSDGTQGHRWQRFLGMTTVELRICIAARRKQVHGHEQVLKVYEQILADLEKVGETARVEQVWDKAKGYFADLG